MKKTLFLFTKTYPFGEGEQYITHELKVLAERFEKVVIYPNDYYDVIKAHNKQLPLNVEIINLNQALSEKKKNSLADYLYLLKNTFLELVETDDKANFFRNFKWNLVNFWTQYQLSKHLADYLKKCNYDLSNSVFYSYWFHKAAIMLSVLKDKGHIDKFVSRAHSMDLYHQYWGIVDKHAKVPSFKMFKYRHVFEIITISNHGANFIKTHFPKYAHKVHNFYLGVFNDSEKRTSFSGNQFLIVTCSHFDPSKRLEKLAEALKQITHSCKWVHFGGGPEAEVNKIKEVLKKLPPNIEVELKGYVSNKEVNGFYKNNPINLFVNLSIVEGVPVSIMEAMSHRIAILATSVYGTPEAVQNGYNGYLLDLNFKNEELVEKINYLILNPEKLKQMGEKSYQLYLEKFNAETNYREFANHLEKL